jgi:hypothetical protein
VPRISCKSVISASIHAALERAIADEERANGWCFDE